MIQGTFAILLDGEFVRRKLKEHLRRDPDAADFERLCQDMAAELRLDWSRLYRVFYYTADPLTSRARNPLDGAETDFSSTSRFSCFHGLIQRLEEQDCFAVRRGELLHQGWKLGQSALRRLRRSREPHSLDPRDIVPDVKQKGVDVRIGLDVAALALAGDGGWRPSGTQLRSTRACTLLHTHLASHKQTPAAFKLMCYGVGRADEFARRGSDTRQGGRG